jgi:hypothetical protein
VTQRRMDDAERKALCGKVELHELIGRSIALKRVGKEYQACCPFHDERSPSFTVVTTKGFYHCFGCGAHGDALSWLIEHERFEFVEACKVIDARAFDRLAPAKVVPPAALPKRLPGEGRWLPLFPVPDAAPELMGRDGRTIEVWNPKPNDKHPEGRFVRYRPSRADAYRDARGRLMGYVLRLDIEDRVSGKRVKITPTVTWCVGPDGTQQWCVQHFRPQRPLYGLDGLADERRIAVIRGADGRERTRLVRWFGEIVELGDGEAVIELRLLPVLVVEGEKCRAAGAGALPQYAVVSWPGGSKGIRYVDWAPLHGRDIVMWPDADKPGREAMLGWVDGCGVVHRGVAQHAHRAGARSLRIIDTEDQAAGWDIADALDPEIDGWSPRQLAAWASTRVCEITVESDPRRMAR